ASSTGLALATASDGKGAAGAETAWGAESPPAQPVNTISALTSGPKPRALVPRALRSVMVLNIIRDVNIRVRPYVPQVAAIRLYLSNRPGAAAGFSKPIQSVSACETDCRTADTSGSA